MTTVGLTGGIGSGKSTVSARLVERGAVLVDADAITRELQQPGTDVFDAMVERFGKTIVAPDGTLDRAAVAAIVFADEKALMDLNAIVHPRVGEVIEARISEAADDAIIIVDVPLLAEGRKRGAKSRYDIQAVLVVDCPVDVAVERLVSGRGFDETDARRRVENQASRDERREMADFVVDNGLGLDHLDGQLDSAWQWLCGLEREIDLTASDVEWDIDTLVGGSGSEGVEELLAAAAEASERLQPFRGKVGTLSPADMAALMTGVAAVEESIHKAASYASLRFAVDTSDGALYQMVSESAATIGTQLLFVELEWAAATDEHVEATVGHDDLAFCSHHLDSMRRYRSHLLSEPEEMVLTEKSVTGSAAWVRLFDQLTSEIRVELPDGNGGTTTGGIEQGLSMLSSPDATTRRLGAEAVTRGLEPGIGTRAYVFNTLLQDKSVDDRLRSYPTWVSSRNLANEATDDSVESLVEAVQARYGIARRWYRLKAEILGCSLKDYDRMASVAASESEMGWAEAKELVLDAYRSFSPQLADVATMFFDQNWIDAPVREAKRPGAFCSYTVPSHHPYVFLNWTGKSRDVLTLAHELGHGCHAYLSRGQGIFHYSTPLTLAETASVFGETVTFQRLLEATTDPNERLALLSESIEGSIATVFRQTAMNRFENAVHRARRSDGELSVDQFGDLWAKTQRDMLGDTVEITDGYRSWWSYVPHFIGTPGYVYAYAYGQLLALSVYRRYEEVGEDFVESYLELLGSGGSMPPVELGKIVGCDLADGSFWDGGLDIVEGQLNLATQAAEAAGRI